MARVVGVATVLAVLVTVALRAIDHDGWRIALGVSLAVLALRLAVLAWQAGRGELPWTRVLLPAVVWIEGVGLGSATRWQVRLGTAIALEVTLVAIAIRALARRAGDDLVEAQIARALTAILPPRIARLAAFELVIVGAALRFAAGGWRRAVPPGFTYHRHSGLRMLLPMLPLLAFADVLLLELVLLPHAAIWLRVVVHVLAVYGLIWLLGLYASLRARPHQLADGVLVLHRGLLGNLALPVTQIATVAPLPSFGDDWKQRAYCRGAIRLDVAGAPILELQLHTTVRATGVLGEGKPSARVLIAVDDPAAFTAALRAHGPIGSSGSAGT